MSKKDKIKEDISVLRDEYKNYFISIMTFLTGSFTTFYQVLIHNKPTSVFVSVLFKKKRLEILEDLK